MLSLHFENTRVFVLIDEYDTPINSILSKNLEFITGNEEQNKELKDVIALI